MDFLGNVNKTFSNFIFQHFLQSAKYSISENYLWKIHFFFKEQTEKYARSTTGQQEQGQFQQDKGKQQVNQTFEPY